MTVNTAWSEQSKEKTSWAEASRVKSSFSGRNKATYTTVLDPVLYNESTVTYNDDNCFYNGPKVTVVYSNAEEKTSWAE